MNVLRVGDIVHVEEPTQEELNGIERIGWSGASALHRNAVYRTYKRIHYILRTPHFKRRTL